MSGVHYEAPLSLVLSSLWQQMDNAVYTFEQLLNQSLEGQSDEDLCKTIQKCEDRVLKVRDRAGAGVGGAGEVAMATDG